ITVNNTTVNRTTVNNTQVLAPARQVAAAKGVQTVPVDSATRVAAQQQARQVQQVAATRGQLESSSARAATPRAASLPAPGASATHVGSTVNGQPATGTPGQPGAHTTSLQGQPKMQTKGPPPKAAPKKAPPRKDDKGK